MPALDYNDLATLRIKQADAAQANERCRDCTAQTWPNYCRQCDDHFKDGHWDTCKQYSKHQAHRTY